MRTKLLKKLKKKYDWYFNKEGFPVLIQHKIEHAEVIDLEYCLNYYNVDKDVKLEISQQEWALRCLKNKILGPYGYHYTRSNYRLAQRNLKRNQPK